MDGGDDLQVLIDELAAELGRSVVINDPVVRMLYASKHFGDEDDVRVRAVLQRDAGPVVSAYVLEQGVGHWTRPGVVQGRADLGMHDRLCVPLRERGELLGMLMLIDAEHTLTAAELARIDEVARTASALLHQRRLAENQDRAWRERALLRLLGPDAASRAEALRALATPDVVAVVAVLEVRGGSPAEVDVALHSVLDSAAARHPRTVRTAVRGNQGVVLWTGVPDVAAQVDRMVSGVGQLLGQPDAVVAGIGGEVDGLGAAWRSHEQALVAVRGAARVAGAVAHWAELGPYAVLLQLPDGPVLLPEAVARLAEHDRTGRLVETLRVYLDTGGSIRRTAEALHLHRTSLYYRLDQIRTVTGADLDDGRTRLLLHMGLLLADLPPDP